MTSEAVRTSSFYEQIQQAIPTTPVAMFAAGGAVHVLAMWVFEPTSLLTQAATWAGTTTAVLGTSALCGRCCRRADSARPGIPSPSTSGSATTAPVENKAPSVASTSAPWHDRIGTTEQRAEKGFGEFIEACKEHGIYYPATDELEVSPQARLDICKAGYQALTHGKLFWNFQHTRFFEDFGGEYKREKQGITTSVYHAPLYIQVSQLSALFKGLVDYSNEFPPSIDSSNSNGSS